jgi:DNA-directed RNA polymerase subunit L
MALINNLKINDDFISFEIKNNLNKIKNSFSNAIRRTIINDIHTYLIDYNSIVFFEDGSMLDKEFLKQRLILIPIISNTDLNYENIIISCKINNEDENIKSIYVNDFVCFESSKNKIIDNNIIFKYPKIIFSKIENNEFLSFEAKLIKNNSKNGGAFFSPVSECIYTFKIDDKKVSDITKNFNKDEIKSFKTQDIERIYEKNTNGDPNCYLFKIESIGFYDVLTTVLLGIDELIKKLVLIKNEFNNIEKSNKISILENNNNPLTTSGGLNPDFVNFSIDDENDTLGNLLSTYISDYKNVLYCGYLIEHPLKKNIVLRIKLDKNNDLENIIKVIIENIDLIIDLLKTLKIELTK